MAKIGLRHREDFNEIVGNLPRDAVQLTLPNRMALLALNNKVFSNGMDAQLATQQPQNPLQQVGLPGPPPVAPYMPTPPPPAAPYVPPQPEAAAPADGKPSWMGGLGGLAGKLAGGGAAVAKTIYGAAQSQAAAAAATDDDDYLSAGDYHSELSAQDMFAIQQDVLEQELREQARSHVDRAFTLFHQTHPQNPFASSSAPAPSLLVGNTTEQILQHALEDGRPTYPDDGSDLIAAYERPPWMESMIADASSTAMVPQSTALVPQYTDVQMPQSSASGSSEPRRTRQRRSRSRNFDPTMDTERYQRARDVPGANPDAQVEYLLAQQAAGMGQPRRQSGHTTTTAHNPFADVFRLPP
jgi:hypothetical protein